MTFENSTAPKNVFNEILYKQQKCTFAANCTSLHYGCTEGIGSHLFFTKVMLQTETIAFHVKSTWQQHQRFSIFEQMFSFLSLSLSLSAWINTDDDEFCCFLVWFCDKLAIAFVVCFYLFFSRNSKKYSNPKRANTVLQKWPLRWMTLGLPRQTKI